MNEADNIEQILGIFTDQKYCLKVCLKRVETMGEHGVSPEITQIHDIETVVHIYTSETSRKDTVESLESLMLPT